MIRFFAGHPTAANLLMLALLSMGVLSLGSLRRETFPDFSRNEIEIRVPYPGATAEDIEETVCTRIEDAVDAVRFVKEIECDARDNVGITVVEMEDGHDLVTFKDEIDTEVRAIDDFPEDVKVPIITQLHTTEPVLSLLVSGPMGVPDLKAYCEDLKDRLKAIPEISLVTILGFSDHQFRVELQADALRRFNLSAARVADIIARQSVELPAGTLETHDREILIRFDDQRASARQLEDLVIVADPQGAEVRLRDLGRVTDRFELEEEKIILDDRRAAILNIEKTKGEDTLRVAAAAKAFVDAERVRYPQLDLRIINDISRLVNDRLTMLVRNGWQGVILVFLAMWAFFNIRLSFWVVMSLPVSFLGAFFFMPHLDLSINMLTMVGLLLALGLLMDDGIVIAENIATHRAQGKGPFASAVEGLTEVGGGVVSSFLTTVCVLGPLAILEGTIGKVLKVVPLILILVLAVSLIEAFCILPHHLVHSFSHAPSKATPKLRRRFDGAIDWIREQWLGRSIDWLLTIRYAWLGLVIFSLLAMVAMVAGEFVKFRAFPDLEGNVVVARILLPPGSPLHRTEAAVQQVVRGLEATNRLLSPRQPDEEELVHTIYARYNFNEDAFDTGSHVATVYAELLEAERRNTGLDELVRTWREHVGAVPDALSVTYAEPSLGPAGRSIELRISGPELVTLSSAAGEVRDWLMAFDGVSNVTSDLRPGKQELRLKLREGAYGRGLDAAALARQLRAAFQGITADEIQVGDEAYEIDVQLAPEDQDSLADIEAFRCTLPDGEQIPLASVAAIEVGVGWSRIVHINHRRTVTLRSDVDADRANTASLMAQLQNDYVPRLHERYPEVILTVEGETKEAATTQASMRRAMLIGVIGIFIILSFQFRSFIEPLIVMTAIPFALIGVIGGHMLLGIDISMPSILGFISLAGIVVNDSILLVLFLKQRRLEGADALSAAALASRQRFRAIVITTMTTVAGLCPLLLERSLQAQLLIPLAVSIVFGLLSSTVLVLLVIPCLYVILDDLRLTAGIRASSRGEKPQD